MLSLDLLYSTVGDRIVGLIENLPEYQCCQNIIIVHQVDELYSSELVSQITKHRNDIVYKQQVEKGVTKSRNLAIELSTADYLLFCDDDVIYENNLYLKIISNIKPGYAGCTFRIKSEAGGYTKSFKGYSFVHSKFTILSVGTIEVLCDGRFVRDNMIRFPEELGAGAKLPNCDEPVFLSRIMRSGGRLCYIPITVGLHPEISSGQSLKTFESVYSRKVAFEHIFGRILSIPLFLLFIAKKRKSIPNEIIIKSLRIVFKVNKFVI